MGCLCEESFVRTAVLSRRNATVDAVCNRSLVWTGTGEGIFVALEAGSMPLSHGAAISSRRDTSGGFAAVTLVGSARFVVVVNETDVETVRPWQEVREPYT